MHNLCEVAEKKVSMVLRLRQITYIKVFAFSFLCTLFVIYLHLALPSMFNQFAKTNFFFSDVSTRISEPYGEYVWNLHTTHPVFARRQLTTQVVHLFQHVFDIGIMPAFILLQSLLLFFSGVALFYFIRAVELEKFYLLLCLVSGRMMIFGKYFFCFLFLRMRGIGDIRLRYFFYSLLSFLENQRSWRFLGFLGSWSIEDTPV